MLNEIRLVERLLVEAFVAADRRVRELEAEWAAEAVVAMGDIADGIGVHGYTARGLASIQEDSAAALRKSWDEWTALEVRKKALIKMIHDIHEDTDLAMKLYSGLAEADSGPQDALRRFQ